MFSTVSSIGENCDIIDILQLSAWASQHMVHNSKTGYSVTESEFGKNAVIHAGLDSRDLEALISLRPVQIELNMARGWVAQDLGFLKSIESLRSLVILTMQEVDLQPIRSLESLVNLELTTGNKKGVDLSGLQQLSSCTLQWASGFESIFSLRALKKLTLIRMPSKFSEQLAKMRDLEVLQLFTTAIRDIDCVKNMANLSELRLARLTQLEDISGLSNLTALTKLNVNTCRKIGTLSSISGLPSLRILYFDNCGKTDSLHHLQDLGQLEDLSFYETTEILDGDIACLLRLPSLKPWVSYQNRKSYNLTREQLNEKLAEKNAASNN